MENYYDEQTHSYYVNGELKPSVTDICEPISFRVLNALDKVLLDRARARGSRCHELFEEYLLTDEMTLDSSDNEYIPYLNSFIEWEKTYKPKVLFTEKQLWGEDYCGTTDLVCVIDGKTLNIDYKVKSSIDKKYLSVQMEGYYRKLVQELPIDESWYLQIKKNGYVFKKVNRDSEWFDLLLAHNKKMKEKYKE